MKKKRKAPDKKKIRTKAGKDFFKDTDIMKSLKGVKDKEASRKNGMEEGIDIKGSLLGLAICFVSC